jgi:hypothetical protein
MIEKNPVGQIIVKERPINEFLLNAGIFGREAVVDVSVTRGERVIVLGHLLKSQTIIFGFLRLNSLRYYHHKI